MASDNTGEERNENKLGGNAIQKEEDTTLIQGMLKLGNGYFTDGFESTAEMR